MNTVVMILSLLCGVALFMYGMSLMGDGLKRVAGDRLESFLYRVTNTPLKGLLLGAGVTSVIQSSSATTVMVVGFVNSGMITLFQAIGIIIGANIGTSITGWVLCLSYIEGAGGITKLLSSASIAAVAAIMGTLLRMLSKRSAQKHLGDIMLGFAILMTGMQMMSAAVSPLRESKGFINTLTMFSNPFLGILLGIVMTAILQSASASIGILQALSVTGVLAFSTAFPVILGIGVGASCPVLLSAIGANKNAQRDCLSADQCFRHDSVGHRFLYAECLLSFFLYGNDRRTGKHRAVELRHTNRPRLYPASFHQGNRTVYLQSDP